ncbi:hypothetical protein RBU49_10780 [Clostridium sp. MB40-C1]|uniref:hypothetical protein n=1 Tax=Clostridium sp. MB40-C1 TaxID=3070996 RepID=UPI0027E1DCFF|nr:hypothetical protein [Clostridium sp. MB40-C1]WMJ79374.1 hypothetical protein RBU49_10780 [Clostridium sp. MB40-C1]
MLTNPDDLNNLEIALKKIISYFEIPSYYGEIEKEIYTYYSKVLINCSMDNFINIDTYSNLRKKYLKINPDYDNSIIQTMKEADFLIKKIKKNANVKKYKFHKNIISIIIDIMGTLFLGIKGFLVSWVIITIVLGNIIKRIFFIPILYYEKNIMIFNGTIFVIWTIIYFKIYKRYKNKRKN